MNLDECKSMGTHWVSLWENGGNVTYFESFGVEHIPREIETFGGNKNIKTTLECKQMIQWYMYTFVLDLLWEGKGLLDYTNLFSNKRERNDKITKKFF